EIIDEALKTMDATEARLVQIRMDAKAVADEGMLCGGNVYVLLEPLLVRHKEVYEGLANCEKKGVSSILVTRLKTSPIQKCLLDRNGVSMGDKISEDEVAGLRDF